MELLIRRRLAVEKAIAGELFVNGRLFSFTLENEALAVPAGRYRLDLTVSSRSLSGELWSPDPQFRLPLLVDVPGRSGIRIHAANEYDELSGCIALGRRLAGSQLLNSRPAVMAFMDLFVASYASHDETWLTIEPAGAVAPRVA